VQARARSQRRTQLLSDWNSWNIQPPLGFERLERTPDWIPGDLNPSIELRSRSPELLKRTERHLEPHPAMELLKPFELALLCRPSTRNTTILSSKRFSILGILSLKRNIADIICPPNEQEATWLWGNCAPAMANEMLIPIAGKFE